MGWKETSVVDERERFVLRALEPRASMSELCREFGISRKTGYKWRSRFELEGRRGLEDRSRRPRSCPKGISGDVVAEILTVRWRHPTWGSPKIRAALERHGVRPLPCERSIDRVLARVGLIAQPRRRRRVARVGDSEPVTPTAPNDLWTVDFKGWWRTKDSRRCEPLTIRDAFSRFVLEARLTSKTDTESTQEAFEEVFRRYGLPKAILSDNGSPFASTLSLGGLTRLSSYWVALGITPYRIRPGNPQQNGAHERMHRDIKAELQRSPSKDKRSQQAALEEWRFTFNHERPHQALGMKTPAELYSTSRRKYRGERPTLTYPSDFEIRRVRKNGSIKFHQRQCFISEALARWDIGMERTAEGLKIWFAQMLLGSTDPDFEGPVEPAA